MAEKQKSTWVGFTIGLGILGVAVSALWKNETRFDYHRAAQRTAEISKFSEEANGQLISHTASMDQGLTMKGHFVDQFQGYLYVKRSAEIYCWHKRTNDDKVTWSKSWSSSVERNSRNNGLTQTLRSKRYEPEHYEVGKLKVQIPDLEFADSEQQLIGPELVMTEEAKKKKLEKRGDLLYLQKNESNGLGDERLIYRAIPIPPKATYFGKYDNGLAVADKTHQRTGLVSQIIQDTGILHHLVGGDRQTALGKLKSKIQFTKWLVRGIGSVMVFVGILIALSSMVNFLMHIPVIGSVVQLGVFVGSIAIAIPIALGTIITSYLISHPVLLALLIGASVAVFWWLRSRGKKSQDEFQQLAKVRYGKDFDQAKLKEQEFMELAALSCSDNELKDSERQFLLDWGRRQGWSQQKAVELIDKAKDLPVSLESSGKPTDEHLKNLVFLAMADGELSSYERRTIWSTAKKLGYDSKTIRQLIDKIVREVKS